MRKITNPIVIGIVRRCKPITLLLTTCGSADFSHPLWNVNILVRQRTMTAFIILSAMIYSYTVGNFYQSHTHTADLFAHSFFSRLNTRYKICYSFLGKDRYTITKICSVYHKKG